MKNLGLEIHNSILEYSAVYEAAGIKPPAYRITCKEHKILVDYLKSLIPRVSKPSMIAEYYGIRIEVVMIVDAYL